MPRKHFTAQEIRAILREAQSLIDQGKSIDEVADMMGITPQTFYRWRENLVTDRLAITAETHLFGVYPAVVIDNLDPLGRNRVHVMPHPSYELDNAPSDMWATTALLTARGKVGLWFRPEIGDEVLVAFEAGDLTQPYVIGYLWNGQDAPPESHNNQLSLYSRSGMRITLDDKENEETLTLVTPAGQHLEMKDGDPSIEISDASGNVVRLSPGGITIISAKKVEVHAETVDVTAAMVKVDATMSQFSGTVKADTIIATNVIASNYTPGTGNLE